MTVQPSAPPKWRAFDDNGDPLSGGLLYTYAAGSSTPLSTYTTRAGNVANANPVVLDANGEADVWVTPGVSYKFELRDSAGVVRWTVDNVPSPADTDATTDISTEPGGRLTLTSGTPVTSADVTAVATLYYTPYKHNKVPLYDGSAWTLYSISTELSQTASDTTKSPAAVVAQANYDLFIWSDSGTLRLSRGPVWTANDARGSGAGTTELERVDGRLVNKVSITNGPAAHRGLYVGTVRSDDTATFTDSKTKRFVWNMHNRLPRALRKAVGSATYTYTTATPRQVNADAANQVEVVRGQDEDPLSAELVGLFASSSAGNSAMVLIGLDSTSLPAVDCIGGGATAMIGNSTYWTALRCSLSTYPGLGHRTLVMLECGSSVPTPYWAWQSTLGSTTLAYGLLGECRA